MSIAVHTTMIKAIKNSLPVGMGEGCGEVLLARRPYLAMSAKEIQGLFAGLSRYPALMPSQRKYTEVIASALFVRLITSKTLFLNPLVIFALLLAYLFGVYAMVLLALGKVVFLMVVVVLLAAFVLALASRGPSILIALAEHFGVFAAGATGITSAAQAVRASASVLAAFTANKHTFIIPPSAGEHKCEFA